MAVGDNGPKKVWSPSGKPMQSGCAHLQDPEKLDVGALFHCRICNMYWRVTYFDAGMGGYPNIWKRAGKPFRFWYVLIGRTTWKEAFGK